MSNECDKQNGVNETREREREGKNNNKLVSQKIARDITTQVENDDIKTNRFVHLRLSIHICNY